MRELRLQPFDTGWQHQRPTIAEQHQDQSHTPFPAIYSSSFLVCICDIRCQWVLSSKCEKNPQGVIFQSSRGLAIKKRSCSSQISLSLLIAKKRTFTSCWKVCHFGDWTHLPGPCFVHGYGKKSISHHPHPPSPTNISLSLSIVAWWNSRWTSSSSHGQTSAVNRKPTVQKTPGSADV